MAIPIFKLGDHIRGGARRIAHLNIHALRPEQIAALPVLEGLGKGIELRHIGLRHRGLKAYVKEAVLEVLIDTRRDGDLFPNGKGLDARAEHGPPFKLTRSRKAVDGVNQIRRVKLIIAIGGGEAHPAEEIAVRFPKHHRVLADRIPLHRAATHEPRGHEAKANEGIHQGVNPQGIGTLKEAIIDHGLVQDRGAASSHKGLRLRARILGVRPHHLLGQGGRFRDGPINRRRDANMGVHHLTVEAHKARHAAPLHGQERKVGVRIGEASQEVAGRDEVGPLLEPIARDGVAAAIQDLPSHHVEPRAVVLAGAEIIPRRAAVVTPNLSAPHQAKAWAQTQSSCMEAGAP